MKVRTQYKELSSYVRKMDRSIWDAEETETFCLSQGAIGKAVLYSLTPPAIMHHKPCPF